MKMEIQLLVGMRFNINNGVHVLDMGSATGSRRINDLYYNRSEQCCCIYTTHPLDEVSNILQLRFVCHIK